MVNDKATKYFSHSVTSTIFPLHKKRHLSGHNQTYTKSYHLMLTSSYTVRTRFLPSPNWRCWWQSIIRYF